MRISYEDMQDPSEGITLDRLGVVKLLAEHGEDITPEFLDECKRQDNGEWNSSDIMNWLGY